MVTRGELGTSGDFVLDAILLRTLDFAGLGNGISGLVCISHPSSLPSRAKNPSSLNAVEIVFVNRDVVSDRVAPTLGGRDAPRPPALGVSLARADATQEDAHPKKTFIQSQTSAQAARPRSGPAWAEGLDCSAKKHHAPDAGHGGPAPTASVFPTKARGCWPIFDRSKYSSEVASSCFARLVNRTIPWRA
jgi:hypothetical protein